jgi:ATP-dependent HslUV protease ATP-binding subunit HslU
MYLYKSQYQNTHFRGYKQMNMTPKEIVSYLDNYIIGQKDAKKTIALALRTRYRRMQLDDEMRQEIEPKNILMIGSTGVGKTEISRRLAKMMKVPFIKVEASKYTEVGFVGRDVESMVRDLVVNSISIVKAEREEANKEKIENYIINRITDKLVPPLPKGASESKKDDYQRLLEAMEKRVESGEMDDKIIEIEVDKNISVEFNDTNLPPEMAKVQENFSKIFAGINKEDNKKEVTVKDAKMLLRQEASAKLLDMSSVQAEALRRAENGGIIFLDEIDKIALSEKSQGRNDPSKEGVQRDLLPIVEGSSVSTKYGTINTDHILFIAAGAFHVSKPSDLIPELQGRFPLRVELESLTEETLYKILTQTQNSLLKQYEALLSVEEMQLIFEEEAIRAIAQLAQKANETAEDIGARRLHTVLEKILEDISFEADEYKGKEFVVTSQLVHEKLDLVVEDDDLSRYIL